MRKISAHYYLDSSNILHKYPIVTIENGVIVSIECHTALPEIAGLEFYSGVLLPLFVDLINAKNVEADLKRFFASPFVANFVIDDTIICPEIPDQLMSRVERVHLADSDVELLNGIESCSVVKKINLLVERGYFKTIHNGINFFTSELSKRYFLSLREVAIGCKGEFLIYSDLLFIQGKSFNELYLKRLL